MILCPVKTDTGKNNFKYGNSEYNFYDYRMREPEKTIDVTVEIPVAAIEHIKTDRKPYDYIFICH